jgi:DNA polymerase
MSSKQKRLDVLNNEVVNCQLCRLEGSRIKTVFGEGNVDAKVMFVGEAPGQSEDETGRPFVGRAGKLLDNMIASMGMKREDVYIANICKCRPPGNRKPYQDEMENCKPYLLDQIRVVNPKVIVALGNSALGSLTGIEGGITTRCGNWEERAYWKIMPCYHPSALLRNPNWKAPAWKALQEVVKEIT